MTTKSNVKIAAGAVVCAECEIRGDVTIGARTVIHPKSKIIAEAGPIIIGENNLIEELVSISNVSSENGPNQTVMIIGNNNVFEVACDCQSLKIGDNNILEAKAHLGRSMELTNGCIIGTQCSVTSHEVLPENTVIFGSSCERRVQTEKPPPQTLQLDFLTKILPNYHHLKKTARPSSVHAPK